MKKILFIFTYYLGLCRASTMLDEELYHKTLDEELCALQLETLDTFGFYDASYRLPQRLIKGNLENYGDFHQCLGINRKFRGRNVEGKYCMIHAWHTTPVLKIPSLGGVSEISNLTWTELTVNDDMILADIDRRRTDTGLKSEIKRNPATQSVRLRLGLCVPKTCTVDAVLRPYAEHPAIRFNYSEAFCRLPGDQPYLTADYIGLVVLLLLSLLTVISTAYELRHVFIFKLDPAKASKLLCAFSLYTNTGRLFTFKDTERPLACLNGIRAISVLWIIIHHTQATILVSNSINKMEIVQTIQNEKYYWVWFGNIAVDSFFAISGLLLVYTAASKMKQLAWSNLPEFYLNRYMRLFPLLAIMLLLQSSVMKRVFDGPRKLDFLKQVEQCRSYWWSTLLHLQNIVNPRNLCMVHTWYLSVDMQLYIVSPLVLYWVLRSPRAAWAALGTAIFASLAGTFAFCFYYNFAQQRFGEEEDIEYLILYYYNTVTRSPSFFIGMLFGRIMYVFKNEKFRLPKWNVFLCYCLAIGMSSLALIGQVPLSGENQVVVNLFYALRRSCWALALCWLIFACAHGYGGPVNRFLSLKIWQFVARISYAMYLCGFMIQAAFTGYGVLYRYDTQTLFSRFAADLMYTVLLSVAATILVEAPVATLYSLLLNWIHQRNPRSLVPKTQHNNKNHEIFHKTF